VGNTARVVEVYGPDNLVPGHIIYPLGSDGYVLEAFDGTREAVPDLGAALAVVRSDEWPTCDGAPPA
jgi:hypothetical protein